MQKQRPLLNSEPNPVLGVIAAILVVALGSQCSGTASAQRAFAVREADVIWSARACVGETGFEDAETCAAMTYVHLRRARAAGVRLGTMARLYSSALRRPRRLWVLHLRDSARAPLHWPRARWSRGRAGFRRMVETVRGVVSGEVADPCPGAIHYGGPMDGTSDRVERHGCLPDREQRFYVWRRGHLEGKL